MHKSNALHKLGKTAEALEACDQAIKCGLDVQATAADHFRQVLQNQLAKASQNTSEIPTEVR
jgi:hypothetical protein